MRDLKASAILLCLALVPASAVTAEELDPGRKRLHFLNRATFGPTTADLERIEEIGIDAFLERQLNPDSVDDNRTESLLSELQTLKLSPKELSEKYPRPRRQRQNQMEPGMDSEEARQEAQRIQRMMRRAQREIQVELSQARILRAIHSERQLYEVMVDFWMNHFNVFLLKGWDRFLTTHFEEQVIRPRAFGRFEDLLMAVAKSPAMLYYLDNWLSSAPEEEVRSRLSKLARQNGIRPRRRGSNQAQRRQVMRTVGNTPALFRAKGLNENYARELLELHTVGVDGGYSQEDIVQVAKVLTGWTLTAPEAGPEFRFQKLMHVGGDKVVMGETFKSGGVEEGEVLIRFLARHPATARFIAHKLAVRFVADDPPAALVDAAARTFERTGGDIKEVLRSIFKSPHFYRPELYRAKAKKPLELIASSARVLDARITDPRLLLNTMREMGEALYLCQTPDGYPDVASAWINTNSLLKRLNFAVALAADRVRGVDIDLASGRKLLSLLDLPEPDSEQLKRTAELAAQQAEGGIGETAESVLLTAFQLGSPAFQKR